MDNVSRKKYRYVFYFVISTFLFIVKADHEKLSAYVSHEKLSVYVSVQTYEVHMK